MSRVVAEFGPVRLTAAGASGITLSVVALAVVALAAIRRRPLILSPLALCYAYVLYPRIHPDLALAVAIATAIALVAANFAGRLTRLPWAVITAVLSLSLYWWTLAPTLLPADSAEYQLVARTLGIAHPPGYPLYTLLGRSFTLVPLGDAAYRLNLMSAVLAALTVAIVSRAVQLLTGTVAAALVAALTLAVAPTFWAQATTANIRSMNAFFTALLIFLLIRGSPLAYDTSRTTHHASRITHHVFPFTLGLAVTHHGSLAFLAFPFGLYLLVTLRRALFDARLILRMAAAFLLGCSALLYLPLRGAMRPPLDPGGLTTVSGFLNHVLARGFRGDVFYFTSLAVLPDRLAVLWNILNLQFGLPVLGLAALGTIALTRRRPVLSLLILGSFAVNALVAITYRAPQTVEYLMPAYVALVLLVGCGVSVVSLAVVDARLRAALVALLFLPPLVNLRDNYPSFAALSRDTSTRDYAAGILTDAPTGSTILSNWHYATAFWYLQTVEGLRTDVPVRYIAPQGAEPYGQTWQRRLLEAGEQGPTIVTNRYNEYAALPYTLIPFHGAFLAAAEATMPPDVHRTVDTFGGRFRLIGYEGVVGNPSSGASLTVRLYWQPVADADRDYAFFVHLTDRSGQVWGQHDRTRRTDELRAGETFVDDAVLPLLPTVPPGTYTLGAGVYITLPGGGWQRLSRESGDDSLVLGEVQVTEGTTPPVTAHRLHQRFRDGPMLIGVDYDTSSPDSHRVYLHWRLTSEDGYEVRLWSGGKVVASGKLAPSGQVGYRTMAHDVLPDETRLTLTLHRADGSPVPVLGPWARGVFGDVTLPNLEEGARHLSFGGEMALNRADYRVNESDREVVVDLYWVGLRPLVNDYSVSVQLEGQGWRAQHDSTPALGAIPTLKWLRGTAVTDRHRVKLPPEAAGTATLRVTVYNAFTLEPLVILDDRLLKLGQGHAVEVASVTVGYASQSYTSNSQEHSNGKQTLLAEPGTVPGLPFH